MNPKLLLGLAPVLTGVLLCFHSGAQGVSTTNEWRGFPILPPITNANPTIRLPRSVHVPTRIETERTSNTLSVTIDRSSVEATNLFIGSNMITGVESRIYVYAEGESRPVDGVLGLTGGLDFNFGTIYWHIKSDDVPVRRMTGLPQRRRTLFWHTKPDGVPVPGKKYVVEMELEVFETDIPPQHDWSPQSKNFKVLWKRTLKRTVTWDGAIAGLQQQLDPVESALNFVRTNRLETAQYEMTKPEAVQRISIEGTSAWRVSWRPKTPADAAAINGGQLVIMVHDSGKIEKVFSE